MLRLRHRAFGLPLMLFAVSCGRQQSDASNFPPPTAKHRAIMDLEDMPDIQPIHRENPDFSSIHTISGIKGTIVIRVVIGRDGVPLQATLVHGMAPVLDERALEAAKKWRWPVLLHYDKLPCMVTFVVNACEANGPCTDVDGKAAI